MDCYIVIDAGNHRVKVGHFVSGKMTDLHVFPTGAREKIYHFLNLQTCSKAIISSVSIPEDALKAMLPSDCDALILDQYTGLPMTLGYKTRETLGKDRIAAVAGAMALFSGSALLVVDAGTCMTIDYVDHTGCWVGGNISPGLHMRLKAMHEYTGRLPLVSPEDRSRSLWGQSTTEALANGAAEGMLLEIEGYYHRLEALGDPVKIVATGGDAAILAELTKTKIFVEPNLVLTGLHEILLFHK